MANNEDIGSVVVAMMILVGLIAWSHSSGGDEITRYTIYCAADVVANRCPNDTYYQGSSTPYMVFAAQQTVVEHSGVLPPRRLPKCVVVDKNNWRCNDYEENIGILGFKDGDYFEGTELAAGVATINPQTVNVKYVSWVRWFFTPEKHN